MIPSINDFTSYWQLDKLDQPSKYVGVLFGENILVHDYKVINLSKLLNDNSRIHNVIVHDSWNTKVYVLLKSNNLYIINVDTLLKHKLVCANVGNIFMYLRDIYLLRNDGAFLNHKLKIVSENLFNGPCGLPDHSYYVGVIYDNKNHTSEICTSIALVIEKLVNADIVTNISVTQSVVAMLFDNNTVINNCKLKNINCIGIISYNKLGIIYDENNMVTYNTPLSIRGLTSVHTVINLDNPILSKSISIPNSPYCAKFNTQNISYYPRYFMNRFIAFIMAVKYGCNIKLPKYLYFMIADYLR